MPIIARLKCHNQANKFSSCGLQMIKLLGESRRKCLPACCIQAGMLPIFKAALENNPRSFGIFFTFIREFVKDKTHFQLVIIHSCIRGYFFISI